MSHFIRQVNTLQGKLSTQFRHLRLHFLRPLHHISNIGGIVNFSAGIVCLVMIIVYNGFHNSVSSAHTWLHIIHVCQGIFIFNILYNITFLFAETKKNNSPLKWAMDGLVMLTIIPTFLTRPSNPVAAWLDSFLYSHLFLFSILTIYSLFEISSGIIKALGQRTNPSLLLSSSFLFFIIIGSLLLMLPRCTIAGGINYIDALFVSTSAVCITGLTTIDVAQVFTPFGVLILSLLLQIGALGVMTFTSFFALFFSGNTSIYSQMMVKDMVYSKTANALLPTLLYIFLFTISIELVGAIAVYFTLPNDFPLQDTESRMIFSGFQSLSAFCNAGFTWIEGGLGAPSLMASNQSIYIVTTILVFAGGIGFPTLVNFKTAAHCYLNRYLGTITGRKTLHRQIHIFDVNTKIVLYTSGIIIFVSIVMFLILEWNNTLQGMTLWHKVAQAIFNSSTPRSSGFTSVNPASFMPVTLIFFLLLMWIGGASQSTAGGIKVNTFAAMLLNLKSIIRGRNHITAFHRTISPGSIRRANAVVGISILTLSVYCIVMLWLEPELPAKAVIFETASALFTVGSSLGITPELGNASKIVICTAMFLGRVGVISLLSAIGSSTKSDNAIYPNDNIIIS